MDCLSHGPSFSLRLDMPPNGFPLLPDVHDLIHHARPPLWRSCVDTSKKKRRARKKPYRSQISRERETKQTEKMNPMTPTHASDNLVTSPAIQGTAKVDVGQRRSERQDTLDAIGFFISGIVNNVVYAVFLSAAADILQHAKGVPKSVGTWCEVWACVVCDEERGCVPSMSRLTYRVAYRCVARSMPLYSWHV